MLPSNEHVSNRIILHKRVLQLLAIRADNAHAVRDDDGHILPEHFSIQHIGERKLIFIVLKARDIRIANNEARFILPCGNGVVIRIVVYTDLVGIGFLRIVQNIRRIFVPYYLAEQQAFILARFVVMSQHGEIFIQNKNAGQILKFRIVL